MWSKTEYRNIRWTKNGERLASASGVLRISSKSGELIKEGEGDEHFWGLDWSPDGKCIITSGEKGKIKAWDKRARLRRVVQY